MSGASCGSSSSSSLRVPEATGIDGREDAAVGEVAVELELHVARALELLEDDLVHLGAGVDERRGEDGEAAAPLDVAGGAQEALGRVERRGVHAAGQDAARCRLRQVVGAREARERVQQHHHVLAALHEALGALDDQLGHGDVVLRGHVERGGHDLALDGALHVGDFLGTLVHEQAHEVHVGVVRGDGGCDVLQHRGLAGLRRADDQAALALADGAHKVDDAGRDGVLAVLHMEALVGVDRREVAEAHPVAALLDGRSVDGRDLLDGGVLLVLARRARLPGHHIALAQAVAADGGQAHVAVRLAGQVALRAQEAVSVGQDVQDAGHLDEALGLHAGPEHGLDELGLLEAGGVHSQLGRLLAQLGHLELGQIVARHAGLHLAGTAVVVVRTALAAVVVAACRRRRSGAGCSASGGCPGSDLGRPCCRWSSGPGAWRFRSPAAVRPGRRP